MDVIRIEPGRQVICDSCSKDWTDLDGKGGVLFQSKAICPDCQDSWIESAARYNEEQFLIARCPNWKSFADWVREDLRGQW